MSQRVTLNIYKLINALELKNKRRYTDTELSEGIGIHRHTLAVVRGGRQEELLSKLLTYFTEQGLDVTVGDLFSVTKDELQ